jgi:hypothetical protein
MPVEKLRSVIGHRNINNPMESLPSVSRAPGLQGAPKQQTHHWGIGSIGTIL